MEDDLIATPGASTQQVREQIRELLHTHGVYDMAAHGWLNAYDHDPDYAGHAMWQTDPPPGVYDEIEEAETPSAGARKNLNSLPLMPWQRCLAVAGADFDGLMEASGLSIGLMLMHKEGLGSPYPVDGDFSHLHWMASMVNLSMASDRLRDFFIAAMFRKSARRYARAETTPGARDRGLYETPFVDAAAGFAHESKELAEAVRRLPDMALKIAGLRTERNRIVHSVATKFAGEVSRRLQQRNDSSEKTAPYDKLTLEDLKTAAVRAEEERRATMRAALDKAIGWYRLLIEASNLAFIAENRYRRLKPA